MPRRRRIIGNTYHVITRGIGRQVLFEEDADYEFYLQRLQKYRSESGVVILAYCLMDNHVHLLLQDENQQLPQLMKKINVSYAGYYNRKYKRIGHLFQDRYKSEVVNDDAYLLTVYRYILKNPEKAGIAKAHEYAWSSYSEFGKPGALTDTALLASMIGEGSEAFETFMASEEGCHIMEADEGWRSDERAIEIIRSTCGIPSGTAIQGMPRRERDACLALLKSKGLSIRQLERLTGINRGVIQRACVKGDGSF